ncbi:2-aminoethylphosphonate ABC transporter permease protein II [Klebsiella pneumoniae]|uniref:2-aminoethylphosphonate ABC transporter permease protein II n=1 Tax=Klebsiella pneumoniae TaxID=573 RepID=A0A377TJ89_KLEPN|nr:2-aminoethylphosphonate ABC transporter permease protein II [Klebsiella pneumoniae]
MLIWSRKGRAAAGALAVTLFAGVFLLPLAVILLSSLSKQWNGLLPTGFTFAHFVNAFRGAAWDSLFSSLMVGFCASLLALLCGMWAALALRQYGATLQKYLGLAFYLPSAIPSVSVGLGILVAFSQGPLQMNGTFFIVLAAHFVLISAFTFSNVTTGLARIPLILKRRLQPGRFAVVSPAPCDTAADDAVDDLGAGAELIAVDGRARGDGDDLSAGLDDAAGDHFQPHRSRQYRRWLGADHCAGGVTLLLMMKLERIARRLSQR